MNYAKAQSELKDKFPPNKTDGLKLIGYSSEPEVWHKYSFNGTIRYYKNKLKLIGETVKYLGICEEPKSTHWDIDIIKAKKRIISKHFKQVNKLTSTAKITEYNTAVEINAHPDEIFTRKNKWLKLTSELILVHPYKGKCCYCEVQLYYSLNYTRDHILPRSRGGKAGRNLKSCCCHCNVEKSDMMLHTYIQMLNYQLSDKIGDELVKLQTKIKNANRIAKEL